MPLDPYTADDDTLAAALPGEPRFRVRQLRAWLARGVDDPAAMTDLPATARARLADVLAPPPRLLRHHTADDGLTSKVLLQMPESGEAIESVLMLYPRSGRRERGRATVCVSTQAGCAMGCPFCATGQAGLRAQLTTGEVVRQVTVVQRMLQTGQIVSPGGVSVPGHVTNVVFMGMGEPLANLEATLGAVRWLADADAGFGLSARSITVSTVGLVPGIRRLADLRLPVRLAVSLHAPDDALRDDLVPVNRAHPLAELLAAAEEYRRVTSRRLTYEYVLIAGVNDSLGHAARLAELLRGRSTPAHVNLIPMNPTPAVPWEAPAPERQEAFAGVLTRAGLPATVRHNRGGSIDAACGQLYASYRMGSGRTLPAAVDAAARVSG